MTTPIKVKTMSFKDQFEGAIYSLLSTEPFYANFLLNSRLIIDSPRVPTAAVSVMNGTPVIMFNTKWIAEAAPTVLNLTAVIKHEILHICLDHLDKQVKDRLGGAVDAYIWNIAQDCMINQEISRGLPKGCVTLESLEKIVKEKLLPRETSHYYYEKLKDYKQELEDACIKAMDEHGAMEGTPEEMQAAVFNVMRRAANASAGNVPDPLVKALGAMMKDAQIPWRQVLSNFIARAVSSSTQNTRKRINRRFELDAPGKKKKRELTLGLCIDSSGSVSDDMFASLMSEVMHIIPNSALSYLIQADCEVHKIEVIRKGKKPALERAGNGGTAYQPAIDACMQRKCDAIIYLGDMDCADTPVDPGIPFLWVSVGGNMKAPGSFGHVIGIS